MPAVTLATQSPKTQQPDSQQLFAALPTLYSSLTFCWPPVIAMAFMKTAVILLVALLAVPSMAQFGELLSKGFSCAYSLMPAQTCGFCQLWCQVIWWLPHLLLLYAGNSNAEASGGHCLHALRDGCYSMCISCFPESALHCALCQTLTLFLANVMFFHACSPCPGCLIWQLPSIRTGGAAMIWQHVVHHDVCMTCCLACSASNH